MSINVSNMYESSIGNLRGEHEELVGGLFTTCDQEYRTSTMSLKLLIYGYYRRIRRVRELFLHGLFWTWTTSGCGETTYRSDSCTSTRVVLEVSLSPSGSSWRLLSEGRSQVVVPWPCCTTVDLYVASASRIASWRTVWASLRMLFTAQMASS